MSLIENIVMSWFDWFGYLIISLSLFELHMNAKKIGQIFVISIFTGIISYTVDDRYVSFLLAVLIFMVILLMFKRTVRETLVVYAISTIFLVTSQGFLVLLANMFFENTDSPFLFPLIIQIISSGILLAVAKKFSLSVMLRFVLSGNRVFLYLIANVFALAFALLLSYHYDRSGFIDNIIVISILFVTIIMINFVILKNGLKNRSQENELRMYKMYAPMIESLMDDLKSRQHEYDNHIQALHMRVQQCEGNADIKEAISQLEAANPLGELAKLQNKLVSGLIYSKMLLASERNIDFRVILKSYAMESALKEYELVEIIGILIDNAFETGVEDNRVYLELREEKDRSVIQVMNKHSYLLKEERERFFKKGSSSKGNKRGYGLFRLNEICKKHHADIIVDNVEKDGINYASFEIRIKADNLRYSA